MTRIEESLMQIINFKSLLIDIRAIDFNKKLSKKEIWQIECFLLLPLTHIESAKEILDIKKKHFEIKTRRKMMVIKITTDYKVYYIQLKQHVAAYQEIYEKYFNMLSDEDLVFSSSNNVTDRYQALRKVLTKGFPEPLEFDNDEYIQFKKYPFKVLKSLLINNRDYAALIPV